MELTFFPFRIILTEDASGELVATHSRRNSVMETLKSQQSQSLNRVGLRGRAIKSLDESTLGGRLTKRRLALGLTQAEVASRVMLEPKSGAHSGVARQISRNAYAMYELGIAEPSLSTLKTIAAALKVTPAALAFGTLKRRSAKTDVYNVLEMGVPHVAAPVALPVLSNAREA